MALPPPPAGGVTARLFEWAALRPIVRVCSTDYPPNTFNPTAKSGRFRPFPAPPAVPIPTVYGSNQLNGALGETVFHDVPAAGGPWEIPRASLYGLVRTYLIPRRTLSLVDLTGWAHKALRLEGRALVECDPTEYPITALWAERFHNLAEEPDGLYWRSRQYDSAVALMLFGDRVGTNELEPVYDETIGLWQGQGLEEVLQAAEQANVTVLLP